MGAGISAIWMLPLFQDRRFTAPVSFIVFSGAPFFRAFELGAASCITLLGIWAVIRHNSPLQVFAFLASAVAGMTLAIAMRPVSYTGETFSFTLTFAGWLSAAVSVTFLVYTMPDIIRLYSGFWFKTRKMDSDKGSAGRNNEIAQAHSSDIPSATDAATVESDHHTEHPAPGGP